MGKRGVTLAVPDGGTGDGARIKGQAWGAGLLVLGFAMVIGFGRLERGAIVGARVDAEEFGDFEEVELFVSWSSGERGAWDPHRHHGQFFFLKIAGCLLRWRG